MNPIVGEYYETQDRLFTVKVISIEKLHGDTFIVYQYISPHSWYLLKATGVCPNWWRSIGAGQKYPPRLLTIVCENFQL